MTPTWPEPSPSLVGVWGVGREGQSAIRFLDRRGIKFIAVNETDASAPNELPSSAAFFAGAGALLQLLQCSLVVVSPGVPRVHPFRDVLASHGVRLTTATNLWTSTVLSPWIGVTGTKGKSTTSSLVEFLLTSQGLSAQLGGNIGIPLTDLQPGSGTVVAELSSYQCAYLDRSPDVAVVTSLFEDHLTWHGSRDQYWIDKSNIYRHEAKTLVCTEETFTKLQSLGFAFPPRVLVPGRNLRRAIDSFALPDALAARHNRDNLALAILAASSVEGFDTDLQRIAAALYAFRGLPHRLQRVETTDGRTWLDDTLATTAESVAAAVDSRKGDLTLIVGGLERGIDYSSLSRAVIGRNPSPLVVAMPSNGERIVQDIREALPDRVVSVTSLDEAVRVAAARTPRAGSILLSPAAPSQDAYESFEHKSEAFIRAIRLLGL